MDRDCIFLVYASVYSEVFNTAVWILSHLYNLWLIIYYKSYVAQSTSFGVCINILGFFLLMKTTYRRWFFEGIKAVKYVEREGQECKNVTICFNECFP